jgi:HSP20 family protein
MMDRMWDSGQSLGAFSSVPIDVWERDGQIYVKASVPGVDPRNIQVNVEDNILTISGEFRDEHETQAESRKMYHREVRYGNFSRAIALPDDVDTDKMDAEYQNGFITIRIPRRQQQQSSQSKRIEIRNADQSPGRSETQNSGQSSGQAVGQTTTTSGQREE